MRISILVLLIIWLHDLRAQSDSTSTGEVVDAEIIIEKDKKIVLPQAEKINIPYQMRDFGQDPLNLTYQSIEPDFNWPEYKSQVGFLKFNEPYELAEYQNFIRAGYGNYSSPLLEAGIFKRFESVSLGSRLYHESFGKGPVAGENSASSTSLFDLSAVYKKKSFVLKPKLSVRRNGFRFYGNTDRLVSGFNTEVQDKAAWSEVDFSIRLNGEGKDLSYFIKPKLSVTQQSFISGRDINRETGFEFQSGITLILDKSIKTGLKLEGFAGNYKGGIEYNRSLFLINPWVSHTSDQLELSAGFRLATGKTNDESVSGFYPALSMDWNFSDKWLMYGFLDGGVEWNYLSELLSENQFMDDSLAINNAELASSFGGGVKGSPIKNLSVKAGISLNNYNGLPFFVPSATDSSAFVLAYDSETVNVFRYSGEAVLSISPDAEVKANIDLYAYSVESLEKAWHKPTYEFSIDYSHNIKEKVLLMAQVVSIGGIRAPVNDVAGFTKLSAFTDLNISVDYKITNRLSMFMKLNNLLNNEYENYIGYPVRGTTFKLGADYRF